ncbi:response regulator transcription factor [Candidatus Colwellia aromaticivorans]|uniref:response regulator transcription factor n=1 Tax=Candidatus Colwellia aromaticivorans TaxID=2267621 RepID=UPI000DF27889|nr:response regulator transcription factor [Candidatus Colwellia aromaticivorans]
MMISSVTENRAQLSNTLSYDAVKGRSILLIGSDLQLSGSGYQVQQKKRHDSIEKSIARNQPEMVVLDIGFSDISKLDLIATIRSIFTGPLILLTSRDSEQEQIKAFNLGVDEYLVKPISNNIFDVRVSALFKRYVKSQSIVQQDQIQLGDIILFLFSFKCQVNGQSITLTQFEFKLLHLLVSNEGKIMSRDFIYKILLGREYNGVERTVDVRMSQLRDKITHQGQQRIRIETVWGQGYMLNLLN